MIARNAWNILFATSHGALFDVGWQPACIICANSVISAEVARRAGCLRAGLCGDLPHVCARALYMRAAS
jgi:hypothetical protein